MDEKETNAEWVEQLGYIFDEYLDEGNYEKCREVIEEIREFDTLAAKLLEAEMMNVPIYEYVAEHAART